MSRIGNKLLSGFYATPERQGEYLLRLLNVEGSGSWFDPTCGKGKILEQLSSPFKSDDVEIITLGVELDKSRADYAENILDHCINASIESMVISNNVFSLLFLNPPYDRTMKGFEDTHTERKEWTELVRNVRYLKEDGVMIYIIPGYRFSDKKIARFLSTQFYDCGIVRFSDEDYSDYRQCVFIGRKKGGKRKGLNQALFEFLCNMEDENFLFDNVTPIDVMIGKKTWEVPSGITEIPTFYTRLESKANFYDGLRNSRGFHIFMERSKPNQLEVGGNPPLPINEGQMALLLASGAINGEIGKGDNYHLVQGLELVTTQVETEETVYESGTSTVTKERTKRDVSVKIITPTGLVKKLV